MRNQRYTGAGLALWRRPDFDGLQVGAVDRDHVKVGVAPTPGLRRRERGAISPVLVTTTTSLFGSGMGCTIPVDRTQGTRYTMDLEAMKPPCHRADL
jgi:hypothetical protein